MIYGKNQFFTTTNCHICIEGEGDRVAKYLNGVVFDKVLLVIPIQLWLVVHYVKSLFSSLLTGMVKQIFGSYKVTYHPDGPEGEAKEIDFTPPFRRLRMFPDLEKALNCKLPSPDTLHTEEARLHLDRICTENQVVYKRGTIEFVHFFSTVLILKHVNLELVLS